jgi:hypothetical protein
MHLSVRTFDERLNPICEHLNSADHITSWPSVHARPGERRPLWQQSRPDTVLSTCFAVSVGYMSPYLLGGLGCAAKDSGTGRVLFRILGCAAKDSGTGRVLFRILGCAAKDSGTGRVLFRILGCAAKDSGTGRVLFRILGLCYFSALR